MVVTVHGSVRWNSKLLWTQPWDFGPNTLVSQPRSRIELLPEAEPARDFIEAMVARYEKRIDELEKQVLSLTDQLQKLVPRKSSAPPSADPPTPSRSESRRQAKNVSPAGRRATSSICENWCLPKTPT